jgi:hypothetical protein
MAYAGIGPVPDDIDISLGMLNTYVKAEHDRRDFYTNLAQYIVWWTVNGRRHKGQDIIPVHEMKPDDFIFYLKSESAKTLKAKEASKHISKEKQEAIRRKQEQILYKQRMKRVKKS